MRLHFSSVPVFKHTAAPKTKATGWLVVAQDQIMIISILAATLGVFLWGRWRHDIVALGALPACVFAGYVDTRPQRLPLRRLLEAGFAHGDYRCMSGHAITTLGLATAVTHEQK